MVSGLRQHPNSSLETDSLVTPTAVQKRTASASCWDISPKSIYEMLSPAEGLVSGFDPRSLICLCA